MLAQDVQAASLAADAVFQPADLLVRALWRDDDIAFIVTRAVRWAALCVRLRLADPFFTQYGTHFVCRGTRAA